MAKRKIEYYSLYVNQECQTNVLQTLHVVTSYIISLERIDRKRDYQNEHFCFMDICEQTPNNNKFKILFKNAKHSYRAPLLDRDTVEERDNPKSINEGEQYKTHLIIDCTNENEAKIYLEQATNLLSMKNIVEYLNSFILKYNSSDESNDNKICGAFEFAEVLRNDFYEVLSNMREVKIAELIVDKSLLGSDAFNFSNQICHIKDDLCLTLKAQNRQSIKDSIYFFFANINSASSIIKKIRIKGRLDNGNESIIATDSFKQKEFVDVIQDSDTGEFNTEMMFDALIRLSDEYIY